MSAFGKMSSDLGRPTWAPSGRDLGWPMAVCLLLGSQAGEADVPTEGPPGDFRPVLVLRDYARNVRLAPKSRRRGHSQLAPQPDISQLGSRRGWNFDDEQLEPQCVYSAQDLS